MRTSLRDVARHLNLHPSTVSRALRNDPWIAEETRRLVQETAAKLGYRPDPLLSVFARHRRSKAPADTLGLACLTHETFDTGEAGARAGLGARAAELGYSVEGINLAEYRADQSVSRILFARGVRGVVLLPSARFERIPDLDWPQFSILLFGLSPISFPAHTVTVDAFRVARWAWDTFARGGCQRIGLFVAKAVNTTLNRHIVGAFLAEQQALPPLRPRIPPLLCSDSDPPEPALRRWLDEHKPDAIVGFSLEEYRLLRRCGVRMPNDLGFLALFAPDRDARTGDESDVAGFVCLEKEAGAVAANLIDALVRQNERGLPERPRVTQVIPRWISGSTCPCHGPVTAMPLSENSPF